MKLGSLLKGVPESNEKARGDAADGRPSAATTAQSSAPTVPVERAQKRGLAEWRSAEQQDAATEERAADEKPSVRFKLFGVGRKQRGERVVILRGYVAPADGGKGRLIKVRAMVDSGAEGDFVSPSLMARIGARAEEGRFGTVIEAFGKETPITQRARDIAITLPGHHAVTGAAAEARYQGELLVAPHELSTEYEVILGQPFLNKLSALWQFGDRRWLQLTGIGGAPVQFRPPDDDEPDDSNDITARAVGRRSALESRIAAGARLLSSMAREKRRDGMQAVIDDAEAEKARRAKVHQERTTLAERAAVARPDLVMSLEDLEAMALGGEKAKITLLWGRSNPKRIASVGMAPGAPGPASEERDEATGGELPKGERADAAERTARIVKEFSDVFPEKLPHIDHISAPVNGGVQIKVAEGTQPQGRYGPRMTPADTETAGVMVKELLELGFIRDSVSDWGAPMFLVDKPDGGKRMVIDYRALNSSTIRNRYPLPRVDELFDLLSGARYFSKIDLRTGYWQIRMAPESISKTAFTSRHGHFEWLVLPMGLTNAPAEFMKMMEDTFREQLNKSVLVFLDDILVFSRTLEEHEQHLRAALQQLRAKKLYGKLSKCSFFRSEVEFLGHHIGRAGVRMVEDKVTAVERFIGLAGFYRKFIKDFSSISAPLTELCGTRKKGQGTRAPPKKTFRWEAEQQRAFDELKRAVVSAPCLALPDMARDFIVHTDSSGYATGAVLMQKFEEGLRPIAFLSKKMRPAERRYPVHEQELLAILSALKAWRHYLSGRRFTVWTDHQSLQYIESSQMATPRQMRWAAWLSEFDFSVRYAPGSKNVVADALSRAEVDDGAQEDKSPESSRQEGATLLLSALEDAGPLPVRIRRAAANDPEYSALLRLPRAQLKRKKMEREGDLLYLETGQFVVPQSEQLRAWIMAWAHDAKGSAHRGSGRMVAWIKERAWWSKIDDDVQRYCRSCEACQRSKPNLQGRQGLPMSIETPRAVGESLSMDFVGPLPAGGSGNTAVLVVVERLSRYVFFVPCKTTSSACEVWNLLNSNVLTHTGVPRVIVSDRDTRFTSHFWEGLWEQLGAELKRSTAFHPQTDGQAERAVRTLVEALRTMIDSTQDNWEELLPHIARAFNSSVCDTTKKTPDEIFFGSRRRTPLDAELERGGVRAPAAHPGAQEQAERSKTAIQEATAAIEKAQQKQRDDSARGRRAVDIAVGDEVWLSRDNMRPVGRDRARKLDPLYCGPFEVARMAGPNAAELILPAGWKIHPVFNLDKLKKHVDGQKLFPARPAGDDRRGPEAAEALEEDPRAGGPASADPTQETFEVESILDERARGRGRGAHTEFLVKWAGWPIEQASWVAEHDCAGALEAFEEYRQRRTQRAAVPAGTRSRRRAMALEIESAGDSEELISGAAAQRKIDPKFEPRAGPGQPTPGSAEAKQRESHWKNTMWSKVQDSASARAPVDKDGQIDTGAQRCTADTKAGGWCKARTHYGCLCWVHRAQLNGTQIKDSTIPGAGKGLFARWDFGKGDAIVRYTGDIVQTADGEEESGWRGSSYVLEVTNSWAIDAARANTADGRMINDTVTTKMRPNVKFAFDARRKVVTIRALRAIKAGEELFISYGREYWAHDKHGGAPQRKKQGVTPNAAPAGTRDDPIALDSLARRVFHCGMLGRERPRGVLNRNAGRWRWLCGCTPLNDENARSRDMEDCATCEHVRPDMGELTGLEQARQERALQAALVAQQQQTARRAAAVSSGGAARGRNLLRVGRTGPATASSSGSAQLMSASSSQQGRAGKMAATRRVNASRLVGAAQIITV